VDGEVVDRGFLFEIGRTYICQAGKKAFARISVRQQ